MYEIIVDARETLVHNKLTEFQKHMVSPFPVISRPLDIGDICIVDSNCIPAVLIERKTIADLVASIKDGRYNEQSYRLNECPIPNHNVIYLIEGNISSQNKHTTDIVYGAIVSLMYYKGFSVIRTYTCDETVKFIYTIANKLTRDCKTKVPFFRSISEPSQEVITVDQSQEKEPDPPRLLDPQRYANVVKSSKKANITHDNIGAIMLSQIPSVSTLIATTIMAEYKTISNLIENLNADPSCLQNMTYINASGRKTKISKTSIANIGTFLGRGTRPPVSPPSPAGSDV